MIPGIQTRDSVLIVGNFLSSRGVARQVCEDLADRLSAAGWSVVRTSARSGKSARLADVVWTVLRRRRDYAIAQVDVFSGASFIWAEAACAALRASRKPYVLTLHGGNLPEFAERRPKRVRALLSRAATVTAPSDYLRERMAPYREEIQVIPNGLDLSAYPFRVRGRPEPQLIWLRAFHSIYNPAMAVQVLALLAPEFPNARLTMVGPDRGDGSLDKVRRVAAELGVSARLSLPGAVPKPEVPAWLDRHDVFINTTNVDNAPVSIVEAMACGLVVISTNAGGLPHLVQDGVTGHLVPVGRVDTMTDATRRVLSHTCDAGAVSLAARAAVERRDWGVVCQRWSAALRDVLRQSL